MAWVLLGIAGLLEVVWASTMKYAEGFTKFWPSVITIVAMGVSLWLLGLSLRTLPLGTAYAIWTGIGAVGAFIVGIVLMGESASPARIASVACIVIGIAGLKLTSGH
jgi:quaternary ammonium compound-resistance protein SugE